MYGKETPTYISRVRCKGILAASRDMEAPIRRFAGGINMSIESTEDLPDNEESSELKYDDRDVVLSKLNDAIELPHKKSFDTQYRVVALKSALY
ncbi:MAG: hypothetical protein FJW63_09025 [Actinobacteria bacterium]|nr:hypothetical protein [Actinomycetota bacterium]